MSVKLRCPQCNTTLTAPNEIIGQTVRCEECEATFTAKKPAQRSQVVDANEAPARPSNTNTRRLADEEDDEDDRPRKKRRQKKSSTNAAPLIFGGLLAMSLIVVVLFLGYYFVRSPKSAQQQAATNTPPAAMQPIFPANQFAPLPNNVGMAPAQPPPIAGDKVRISNARWGGGNRIGGFPTQGDFTFDYECLNGRPNGVQFKLQCKHFDGSTSNGVLHSLVNLSGTLTMKPSMFGRWRQQGMEFWIEENGTRVSNILRLN